MIKAKAKIYHSFENLLQKKTIDHISVTEIIQEAHVARNTFYKYFKDKYDLGIKWFQAAFWDRFDFFDDFSGSYRESVKDLYQHRFLYWHLISSPISQNSIYNYMIFSSIQLQNVVFQKKNFLKSKPCSFDFSFTAVFFVTGTPF